MGKKKNGFTLVELLVTIALMLTILGIAIVSFVSISNRKKEEAWQSVKAQIETAAEEYFTANEYLYEGIVGDLTGRITLQTLVENDYLNKVTNPITGEAISYCSFVNVKKEGNKINAYFDVDSIGDEEKNEYESCAVNFLVQVTEPGAPTFALDEQCKDIHNRDIDVEQSRYCYKKYFKISDIKSNGPIASVKYCSADGNCTPSETITSDSNGNYNGIKGFGADTSTSYSENAITGIEMKNASGKRTVVYTRYKIQQNLNIVDASNPVVSNTNLVTSSDDSTKASSDYSNTLTFNIESLSAKYMGVKKIEITNDKGESIQTIYENPNAYKTGISNKLIASVNNSYVANNTYSVNYTIPNSQPGDGKTYTIYYKVTDLLGGVQLNKKDYSVQAKCDSITIGNYNSVLDRALMGSSVGNTKDGVILLGVGQSIPIAPTAEPYSYVQDKINYQSNDSSIASVNGSTIFGHKTGRTVINLSLDKASAKLTVIVVPDVGMINLSNGYSLVNTGASKGIGVWSTYDGVKNPPIQNFAILEDGYYFSYPTISHTSSSDYNTDTGLIMHCGFGSCGGSENKFYAAFKNAGHMQAFDMYDYNGSKYILMNSKAENKKASNGLYGGYSDYLYFFNPSVTDSNGHSVLNSFSNSKETVKSRVKNWSKFQLNDKFSFAVPNGEVNGGGATSQTNPDVSVSTDTGLMAIRHGNGSNIVISVYQVDPANINLNYELTRFKITKPSAASSLSFQDVLVRGKYVYVMFSNPVKKGYSNAYIYTYDLLGNMVESNTLSINQKDINANNAEAEGMAYYNGKIYFIVPCQDQGNSNYFHWVFSTN